MRTHSATGKPVHVAVSLGIIGARCSLCCNDLTVGVKASSAPDQDFLLFCRPCAKAVGRAANVGPRTVVRL